MRTGMVSASLPDGFTSPNRTSTTVSPCACPVSQNSTIAVAWSRHVVVVTAEPLLKATTTGPFEAFATARRRCSWFPGRSMFVLSLPSASAEGGRPKKTSDMSACAAAAAASSTRSWLGSAEASSNPGAKLMSMCWPIRLLSASSTVTS